MAMGGEKNPFLLARPELISAKKKLALFSSTYDPLKTNLKGFEVYSMNPTEFREQLKNCCQIMLTSEELGALVLLFDTVCHCLLVCLFVSWFVEMILFNLICLFLWKDCDGRVNSQAFISEFLRLGNAERRRKVIHQRKVTEQLGRKKEQYQVEREKSLERLSVYTVSTSFTEEEAQSAYSKLALMAQSYEPQNSIALTVGLLFSPCFFRLRSSIHSLTFTVTHSTTFIVTLRHS